MKRRVLILFLAALMLLVLACKPAENKPEPQAEVTEAPVVTEAPAPEPEPVPEPDNSIVILYTNDTHCGVTDGMGFDGVARVKTALEAAGKNVILVDNGDAVQGDVIGTLSKGEAIIDLMNAMGYDVATIGNHEFDYGMEQFNKNVGLAAFKYVACNFIGPDGNPVLDAYTIIECAGKKIAFVGVATPQTFKSSTPTYFMDENGNFIYSFCEGNNGQDLYDAVQNAVDAARAEGADYVIALTHLGIEADAQPWTSSDVIVHTNGIDAVLDGHSHSVIESETVKNKDGNKIPLTSTGTKFQNVGWLVIGEDGSITTHLISASAIALMDDLDLLNEDGGMGDVIAAAIAKNEELVNKVVAHTDVELVVNDPVLTDVRIVRSQETNLGDLCADAYRAMGESDVAFVNGGGVRASIPAGDITFGQIIKVHPFGNALCVVEATGEEIMDALEFSVSKLPGEFGGFLHVSGMKFVIDMKVESPVKTDEKGMFVSVEGERRVKDLEVLQADGTYAPIDPEKIYTVACHNYLLKDMGDGYTMFADNNLLRDSVMIDNQVLINYIVDVLNGTVGSEYADPYGQGRITFAE
ncbi:MAG: bifunctional metallophosphatase/5'-nucleotidase [Clostridia bacterium]|nr:bifunctional metallophosphatase/5'-nucleotidase [Clostridia bacterium]